MRLLIGYRRQQTPIQLARILLEQLLVLRQRFFDFGQESTGIDIIKLIDMTEVLLFQTRQRAVFHNLTHEIQHRGVQAVVIAFTHVPDDRLFITDIEGDGQLGLDALQRRNTHRVSHGVIQ